MGTVALLGELKDLLVKCKLVAWKHIVEVHIHVGVPVGPGLLVPEARGVHQLVGGRPPGVEAATTQAQPLLATHTANMGGTSGALVEVEVVTLRGAGSEPGGEVTVAT